MHLGLAANQITVYIDVFGSFVNSTEKEQEEKTHNLIIFAL
jgi:hypothetical protein